VKRLILTLLLASLFLVVLAGCENIPFLGGGAEEADLPAQLVMNPLVFDEIDTLEPFDWSAVTADTGFVMETLDTRPVLEFENEGLPLEDGIGFTFPIDDPVTGELPLEFSGIMVSDTDPALGLPLEIGIPIEFGTDEPVTGVDLTFPGILPPTVVDNGDGTEDDTNNNGQGGYLIDEDEEDDSTSSTLQVIIPTPTSYDPLPKTNDVPAVVYALFALTGFACVTFTVRNKLVK